MSGFAPLLPRRWPMPPSIDDTARPAGSVAERHGSAFRQNLQAALQGAARAAMGALLQLIGEPPNDQIATEPQRRSGVIKCPPDTPQFLCRLTGQPGDFAIKLS